MIISRRVRLQLVVFGILTALSLTTIAVKYLKVQEAVGFGVASVSFDFDDATGLYPGAAVTYRGVPVGKVQSVALEGPTAVAVARFDTEIDVPASSTATIHSTSAVGENYIELEPQTDSGPYLRDGSVVGVAQTHALKPTGALLDNLTALARSVPAGSTDRLLKEVGYAFSGGSYDFGRLVTAVDQIATDADAHRADIEALLHRLPLFLRTLDSAAPSLVSSASDLRGFTNSLVGSRGDVNAILKNVPGAVGQVNGLLSDVRSDVGITLADMLSVGQVLKVYLPGLEQVLVVYPGVTSALQSSLTQAGAAPGTIQLGLRPTLENPPTCFNGFLPYKNQRGFMDETRRKHIRPDLYCHVDHGNVRDVRGARNTPCLNNPGVRAASVEECLGYPIGAKIDPLGRKISPAAYDPVSGRVLAPGGQAFELGGLGTQSREVTTWQQLLLK